MRLELLRVRWVIFVAALLSMAAPGYAVQATLVADAHVSSALPAVNSGGISNLNVGAGYTSLVQFDLGVLPGGTTAAQVSKAVLTVFCNRVNTGGAVSVQTVNGAWGEYSVTYATLPALGTAVQTATVGQAGAYVAFDVTAQVQGWVSAPGTNNGLALTAAAADVQFDSKENDQTGHGPTLEMTLVNSGPAGPAGAQGLAGPQGATGPIGSAGAAGPIGPQGIAGAPGPSGVTGPAGLPGVAGSAGPVGLHFQGPYSAGIMYGVGDGVLYGGAGYVSLVAGNYGNTPDHSPLQWSEFASGGAGPAGPAGATGPQGIPGLPGATGATGPAGATGLQGPVGVRYRGTWSAGVPYLANDAVVFNGSTYLALAGNTGLQPNIYALDWSVLAAGSAGPVGPAGPMGPSGPSGPGATVSVGAVATGAAGSQAVVTNSGTASNAVLNFTIPQGQPGAGGANGTSGTDVSAASVYHSVSNMFLFYSVTSGNFSGGTDTAQVLTWVPNGCTASRLMVYSQQPQTITVTLRRGLPSAMNDTGLVCVVSPNQACTATGSVAVQAGDFIDLSAHGATGTPSPVWTALTCN